jgi:hypothetical protein
LRNIEAGLVPLDQQFLCSQYIVTDPIEFLGTGEQQLDLEVHGFWPIAQDKKAHFRASLVSILNMVPYTGEGQMGLAHIKDTLLITNNVQVHFLPGGGTFIQKDELFHWNFDAAGHTVTSPGSKAFMVMEEPGF